jgi:hypothetical protein
MRMFAVIPRLPALVLLAALCLAAPAGAMTSHAGWPADQHLVMDKGAAGQTNVLRGLDGVHNYLLGGYGNDTIYGGNSGDVIWGDYHPSGESTQTAIIHAGNGPNFIYANDTVNYVIHCENPHIVVFTSHHTLPHYKLEGCRHVSFYSVGY